MGHFPEALVDMGTQLEALFEQALFLDHVENGERRRTSDRVAAECSAEATRRDAIDDIGPADNARSSKSNTPPEIAVTNFPA